jgi:ankyrin repeat protein
MPNPNAIGGRRAANVRGYGLELLALGRSGDVPALEAFRHEHDTAKIRGVVAEATNIVDETGWTPLASAASAGHIETMRILTEMGAVADSALLPKADAKRVCLGRAAVHWALSSSLDHAAECALLLVEAGADVAAVDSDGMSAMDLARRSLKDDETERIEEAVANFAYHHGTFLHTSLRDRATVKDIRKSAHRSAIDFRGSGGFTSLHMAAMMGNTDVVLFLLERRARVDARDDMGATALHWAARYGRTATAAALLECGQARAGALDDLGKSPAVHAREMGCAETADAIEPPEEAPPSVHSSDEESE